MGSMMNNYFYGKAGQADYTVEQMPTTRMQLFFTTLKVRFSSMMGLNFLHLLFLLPVIIWLFIGSQTLIFYSSEESYAAGTPEMKEAYLDYDACRAEYEAIINEAENTRLLEYDLEDVEDRIARVSRGEKVMVEVPAVVEGGESTQREVTLDELLAEKQATEEKLAMQETYRAHGEDAAYMEQLRTRYNDSYQLYDQYRRSMTTSNLSMTLLVLIPLLGLAGVGSTGQMYVLRNWARDEHSFMWQDYKAAIKDNWKQGLVIGLFNGIAIFLCFIGYVTYGDMAATRSQLYALPQMFMVVLLVVWGMINEIIFPMMVTYAMNLRQLIRNSAIIVIARLPISFAILVGTLALPFAIMLFVPFVYAFLVLLVLYGFIGFSLTSFVYASYANSCFDKYLNPRIEGAEVNKGLHVPEEEDEDDAPVQPREDRFWEHKSE